MPKNQHEIELPARTSASVTLYPGDPLYDALTLSPQAVAEIEELDRRLREASILMPTFYFD